MRNIASVHKAFSVFTVLARRTREGTISVEMKNAGVLRADHARIRTDDEPPGRAFPIAQNGRHDGRNTSAIEKGADVLLFVDNIFAICSPLGSLGAARTHAVGRVGYQPSLRYRDGAVESASPRRARADHLAYKPCTCRDDNTDPRASADDFAHLERDDAHRS